MLIEWNRSLETGLDEIDQQHKKLVEITNNLHEAMVSGNGYTVVKNIADQLIEYTITHFEAEERLMKDADYPALEEHQQKHQYLLDQAFEFRDSIAEHRISLAPLKVKKFLQTWVTDHIIQEDLQFSAYLFKD